MDQENWTHLSFVSYSYWFLDICWLNSKLHFDWAVTKIRHSLAVVIRRRRLLYVCILWQWMHTVLNKTDRQGYFCICVCVCVWDRERELCIRAGNWDKQRDKENSKKLIRRRRLFVVCVSVCEPLMRVWITVSPSLSRCLRARSADVSQVERCCALWRPALRQSAWTRSTSRISAVPSARVVSGDD